jgi:photoactive yellow protein
MSTGFATVASFFETRVNSVTEEELDRLPYGVIQLDPQGVILRYNAAESRLSGLMKARVVGKNFFKQIAPCTDIHQFYGRFCEGVAAGQLHCTFRFHFAFKRKPLDVTVSLFYNERDKTMWVLVQPFENAQRPGGSASRSAVIQSRNRSSKF